MELRKRQYVGLGAEPQAAKSNGDLEASPKRFSDFFQLFKK